MLMIKKVKYLFKKFIILNLIFGIGMMIGSAIGTSITLGMYGVPDSKVQHKCQAEDIDED
jgi:hypothetical protein